MAEYTVNKAGAKIYLDTSKHDLLEIPKLNSQNEKGTVYEVLSVGMVGSQREPIVSVKEVSGKVIAYRLPKELSDWVQTSMFMSMQGLKAFPSKVEFGIIDYQPYAEML